MVIDCDTHVIPKDAFDYMAEEWSRQKPVLRFNEKGLYTHCDFAGKPAIIPGTSPLPSFADSRGGSGSDIVGMCDFEARVRDMELLGTDRQVLIPQFSPWAWSNLLEPRLASAIARSYNRSILKVMEEYPGKFIGVAMAPLQDLALAAEEIEWSKANDFKAVVCDYTYCSPEHPYGETLGERRELWPFFQKVEEAGLVLYLHAIQHGHRALNFQRFQKIGLDIFAPHDGHMTLVSFITSGLLDEFPGLKVVYTEGGTAWIAPLARRLDDRFKRATADYSRDAGASLAGSARPSGLAPKGEAAAKNKRLPSDYLRSNLFFTIETEEPALAEAVSFLGAGHFLFATDYPHDDPGGLMKWQDMELFTGNRAVSESDKELIRSENAARLFNLR